jgi:hypothetical protein
MSTSSSTFMRGPDEGELEKKLKWASPESDPESQFTRDEDEKTARLNGKTGKLGSSKVARVCGAVTPPHPGMTMPPVTVHVPPMESPAANVALGEVQDFLRDTIRGIMYEEIAQQREELRALHLDMVRMGRNWKVSSGFHACQLSIGTDVDEKIPCQNELRALMDEYVGDFKAFREENEHLRQENERLRRGY